MEGTPDFAALFMKMIAGLVLVLVLAVVFIRFILPRTGLVGGRFWGRRGQGIEVKVLERVVLEPKKSLYIVKLLERYFLLGSAEQSLNLITELSKNEGEQLEGKNK
ncbi:MAG: flagellar biosynthetic protein FliO [Deltaproteobacteria bacterium]|nr:flagellar biosynthetic protein FliO [Deltaproteobacteria bacterium]MBI2500722.1 flagellar biosynthetic protein FliO [Deltaproteobacteria bacterium]MBI4196685.1 flagellar biosynthetic protein FliO [Deltaproteobacteria bacterium]